MSKDFATDLESLVLKQKIVEGKIRVTKRVTIFLKPTNSFMYTTPNACYPKENICNMPKNLALMLKGIYDDD